MKVLNFGSLNLDYVYAVDHFVQPGETEASLSQQIKAGGKGLNQSIALVKAGVPVYHAGCVGQGGTMLKELLIREGVDCAYLRDSEEIQGNAVIQVNRKGDNSILLFGGSNRCITEEQIDSTLSSFEQGDYLLLQNEINGLKQIVDLAYEKGMKIFLNPSPYNENLADVDLHKITWILINEVEAEQISGKKEPDEIFAYIHEKYPELSVLLTLGENGSIAWKVEQGYTTENRQQAFPVTAVDTTAAGDTYTGYFISGLVHGESLADCMKKASLASSICVGRSGAADSIPYARELDSSDR